MSSARVRELVLDFLTDNYTDTPIVDFTGHFEDFREFMAEQEIQPDSPFVGVDFIGDDEFPVSLAADNSKGLYRETGLIQIHVCEVGRIGVGLTIVQRAEVLRTLFRGQRIGGIVIESVSPVNMGPGATLEFEAGYVAGTVRAYYHFDTTPDNT